MSWSDRRYGLESLNPAGDRPLGTYWIIGVTLGVNILVWIVAPPANPASFGSIIDMFGFEAERFYELWRIPGSLLLHGGPRHIFYNMLLLFFMGRLLEGHFGTRRFVTLYVCFGIAGLVGVIFGYLIPPRESVYVIGASGAVMGLVGLFGARFPMVQIMLWGMIAMRGWVLAAILIGLDVLSVLANRGQGGTSHAAHLGGAVAGIAYGLGWSMVSEKLESMKASRDAKRQRRERERKSRDAHEMDRILEKIQEVGMDRLSESERSFLLEQSERLKGRQKQP